MADNNQVVEDIEIKKVEPSPDSPDDEYLPVPGASPQTEPAAVTSPTEQKPEVQPAAPAAPVAPVVETKPSVTTPVVPAPVVDLDKEDVSLLAHTLQNLSTEYKRQPSESLKEYALRLEVINTRKKLWNQKSQELLGEQPKPAVQPVPGVVPEDIDPDDLADFNKKARAAGFVPVAEVQAATSKKDAERAFQAWISSHPEYDNVHDPEGVLFEQVKNGWNSGLYITDPTRMKDPFNQTQSILNKIHQDVFGIKPTSELAPVLAQQEKVKVASHTGTAPGDSSSVTEDKTASTKKALLTRGLKGFSDEEIDELAKED